MSSYSISKKGSKYFVQNSTTKKVMGHHDSITKAKSQVSTLNQSEASTRSELKTAVKVHMTGSFPPVPTGK